MVMQFLQPAQAVAQRLANTPAGQRAAELAQRGMDAAGRLENKWPSLPRGLGGQFPSREAIDRVPLQPFSRGAAGALGLGGVGAGSGQFEGVRDRFAASPQSTVPQSMWDDLTARGGGTPSAPPAPATLPPPAPTTLMDSIMADRPSPQSGAFGMGGPQMPAVQYGSATPAAPMPMPMGEPGYSGAAGAMVPTAAEAARRNLPGRTPGFLDRMLSGPDYQSNNMPVNMQAAGPSMPGQQMPNTGINWGDAQSAADFFRADQMLRQNPGLLGGM